MTDPELIQALLAREDTATEEIFYVRCRPLLSKIMRTVFSYKVEYDELVNELYQYLMKDDGLKLKQFDYRSSFFHWLKIVAIRYFIQIRDKVIEDVSKEPLYEVIGGCCEESMETNTTSSDLNRLFHHMDHPRYVHVLKKLLLEDVPPDDLARSMGITTANLYNIKKRAMAALVRTALNDINNYGKK